MSGAASEATKAAASTETAAALLLLGHPAEAEAVLVGVSDTPSTALVGEALARQGRPLDALPQLIGALEQDPSQPAHWRSLIATLADAGLLDAARQALSQGVALGLPRADAGALEILLRARVTYGAPDPEGPPVEQPALEPAPAKPGPPPALVAEAKRLYALFLRGKHGRVAALARQVARRWPYHSTGHEFLASALEACGRPKDALAPARRLVSLAPGDVAARMRLDRLIAAANGGAEAVGGFGVTTLPPEASSAAEAWQRANQLHRDGCVADAIVAYRAADALCPNIAEIKHALAALLQATGRFDECVDELAKAVAIKPRSLHLRQAHAGVLLQQLRYAEAAEAYRAALELDPDNGECLTGLAAALKVIGALPDAEAMTRRAIDAGEDSVSVHATLGHILQLQGRIDEALACFRKALARDPDDVLAGSGLLFCETHNGDGGSEALFNAHRDYGARLERRIAPMHHARGSRAHAGAPRLGFVSGDLRAHAVAHFVAPFLFELRARGFELYAYSTYPTPDHVTAHLRGAFACWTEAHAMSDEQLAHQIAADRVDVLFDLSGHTAHHRLAVFAARPAPVQVSWIGYPATTGLGRMDYFICNAMLAPHGLLEGQFTEKLLRLPFSTVFDPFRIEPPVAPLPAQGRGHVTFGSFNRLSKVTPEVIGLWSRILAAAPATRMMVAAIPDEPARLRLLAAFAANGIPAERLDTQPRASFERYLALHDGVDLILDTFPYAGGTSTCFAQWQGVPTLTLAGATMQSRVGASLMAHLGLHGFVANSTDDYVEKAVAWAARWPDLAAVRAGLRPALARNMTDATRVVDGLEVALHSIWRRWCHGLPPESLDIALEAGSILDVPLECG